MEHSKRAANMVMVYLIAVVGCAHSSARAQSARYLNHAPDEMMATGRTFEQERQKALVIINDALKDQVKKVLQDYPDDHDMQAIERIKELLASHMALPTPLAVRSDALPTPEDVRRQNMFAHMFGDINLTMDSWEVIMPLFRPVMCQTSARDTGTFLAALKMIGSTGFEEVMYLDEGRTVSVQEKLQWPHGPQTLGGRAVRSEALMRLQKRFMHSPLLGGVYTTH